MGGAMLVYGRGHVSLGAGLCQVSGCARLR